MLQVHIVYIHCPHFCISVMHMW